MEQLKVFIEFEKDNLKIWLNFHHSLSPCFVGDLTRGFTIVFLTHQTNVPQKTSREDAKSCQIKHSFNFEAFSSIIELEIEDFTVNRDEMRNIRNIFCYNLEIINLCTQEFRYMKIKFFISICGVSGTLIKYNFNYDY